MSKTIFQFHGHRDEVIDIAQRWARELDFHIAVEQFWPVYRVAASPTPSVPVHLRHRLDRIGMRPRPFDASAQTDYQFLTANPDSLFLLAYVPEPQGLAESSISGMTQDEEILRLWRRLIRTERERMHKGATVRSFDGVRSAPMPNHRHTRGAHELALQGVRMLAAGGGNEIIFDDLGSDARPGR